MTELNDNEISSEDSISNKLTGDLLAIPDDAAILSESYTDALEEVLAELERKSSRFSRDRFNKNQYRIVSRILLAFQSGQNNIVLEAPTGTGKSIIGIVVAETLKRINHTQSYLLTSNKFLQNQMEADANEMKLNWILLKGQNNYTCHINGKPFGERDCSDKSISEAEKRLDCAKTCEYINTRRACMDADGSILSYSYWLTTMNFVYASFGSNAPFQIRDLTIFDECHTVADQVQNLFTVQFNNQMAARMESLKYYVTADEKDEEQLAKYDVIIDATKSTIETMFIHFDTLSSVNMLLCIKRMRELCEMFCDLLLVHKGRHIPEKTASIDHKRLIRGFERLATLSQGMGYYIESHFGMEDLIVKHIEETYVDGVSGPVRTLVLRSLDEAALMRKHVFRFSDRSLMMSATIGDIAQFARLNGVDDYAYISIDSNFKFDNSPIRFVKPYISLAQKSKHASMPTLMSRIQHIVDVMHPNERGIIHTGNFEISNKIQAANKGNGRYIYYRSSQEKENAVELLKRTPNGVIVGPSLVEGLSLDDEMARFAILAKVPYPSLADELNKQKLAKIPEWYQYKTLQQIIQSLGRHIRNENDWGHTYLMDQCYQFVFKNANLPNYIKRRIAPWDITESMSSNDRIELDFL